MEADCSVKTPEVRLMMTDEMEGDCGVKTPEVRWRQTAA